MAEILIKGLEMPKGQEPLVVEIYADGGVIEREKDENGATFRHLKAGVNATELPQHGRLGDLDKLARRASGRYGDDFARFIKDAPTILETST